MNKKDIEDLWHLSSNLEEDAQYYEEKELQEEDSENKKKWDGWALGLREANSQLKKFIYSHSK